MMQLLYGNDGINYHTIAKSAAMTSIQEKELLSGYIGYDFVFNTSKYSSVYQEPISLSYVTTNLRNSLQTEMILLSRNARMSNYLTPSYYSHLHLIEMTEEMYSENFFDLLQYAFIKDVDLKDYLNKDIDSFVQGKEGKSGIIRRDAVKKEKLVPIVASILNVIDSISQQVHLVLDVEGDNYNQRALEVIASIFACLPCTVRKKAGFSTYASINTKTSSRIKLQLHTREALDRIGSGAIDLANIDSGEILRRIPDKIVQLARGFVEQDASDREKKFLSYRLAFKLRTITIEDHIDFDRYINIWQKGELEKIKDELAKYAANEMKKEKETPILQVFRGILERRFREENFIDSYQKIIKKMLEVQKRFEFDGKLKAYIMLGEALECLRFDTNMFLDWEQDVIIQEAEHKYEDMELHKCLRIYQKKLHNSAVGGKKYKEVIAEMDQSLEERLSRLKDEIKGKIKKEGQDISEYFAKGNSHSLKVDTIRELYMQIKYKENKSVFAQELCQKFENSLGGAAYIESYSKYERYKKWIEDCGEYLGEDGCRHLAGIIEQKGEIVVAMEKYKEITWERKQDVLTTYRSISQMHAVSDGHEVKIPDYHLWIEGNEYILKEHELEVAAENILCPNSESMGEFGEILRDKRGFVRDLLKIKVFGEGHFDLLTSKCSGIDREKVLKYYLQEDIMLSEEKAEEYLDQIDEFELKYLRIRSVQDNILGMTLKKRIAEKKSIEYEWTEKASETHRDITTKEIKVSANKQKSKLNVPLVMLISTLIPVIFVLMEVFFQKKVSDQVYIPAALTACNLLFVVISFVLWKLFYQNEKSGWLGVVLGGMISFLVIWSTWYLY